MVLVHLAKGKTLANDRIATGTIVLKFFVTVLPLHAFLTAFEQRED